MAIGAMKDRRTPALPQPGNLRKFIGHTHGEDKPARRLPAAAVDLNDELTERALGVGHPAFDPMYGRVTFDLPACLGDNLARRLAILPEETV